ncbi:MAG TPA: PIG-L deacetylase family protein [Candidatus Saccharimonadales bacterium]|nr:PIG-L deacetylase family protein [Candidatus Saccharimonadales bacterium]
MNEQTFEPLKPRVVLGIAAHPDDLDVGAAGTLAKFAKDGAEVHYLVLTDGSKGSDDPEMTSAQLIEIRRAEQETAVKAIHGTAVHFLQYPDAGLEVTQDLKRDIVRVIRQLKPDTVITFDPTCLYSMERGMINHTDHRAAGQAAIDAVFPLARDRLTFPELLTEEGLEPHKVTTLLLMLNFEKHNFSVDITDTIELKLDALRAHASQIGDMDMAVGWMRERAAQAGKEAGYDYAEHFIRLEMMR